MISARIRQLLGDVRRQGGLADLPHRGEHVSNERFDEERVPVERTPHHADDAPTRLVREHLSLTKFSARSNERLPNARALPFTKHEYLNSSATLTLQVETCVHHFRVIDDEDVAGFEVIHEVRNVLVCRSSSAEIDQQSCAVPWLDRTLSDQIGW